jgi:hypothetical protein
MKIKGSQGYRYIRELGGAIQRETPSKTALVLLEKKLVVGRVLDFGCGFGFDANKFGWEKYDPHYFQKLPTDLFDTIISNHVANILTRKSREKMFKQMQDLLTPNGFVYVSVTRKIPERGKLAIRKRIQNYVVLENESVYKDSELEIYRFGKEDIKDVTTEIETRL